MRSKVLRTSVSKLGLYRKDESRICFMRGSYAGWRHCFSTVPPALVGRSSLRGLSSLAAIISSRGAATNVATRATALWPGDCYANDLKLFLTQPADGCELRGEH